MSRGRLSRLCGLALWAGGLALAVAVLVGLGNGALAAPPVDHGMAGLSGWIAERDAATVVMVLFRMAGLAMALYLAVATAIGIAARLSGVPAAVSAVDVFTVPLVRRVLTGTVGVILAAGPLIAPGGGYASVPDPTPSSITAVTATPDDPPVMRRLPDGPGAPTTTAPEQARSTTIAPPQPATTSTSTTTAAPPPSTSITAAASSTNTPMTTAGPAGAPTDLPPAASPARATNVEEPPTPAAPTALGSWTVRPGDHLWLIAATVAERHSGTADARLVDRYWRAVIDLNRSSLPDPHNPDLLFSGMEIRLPPLPV
ncbi:MAG: hypothetical protein NVS3B21_06830 [Acidimicrobiales bacterium]